MHAETIRPGDYYEDVFFHPCLCTAVDAEFVSGISLIDGSAPRTCDVKFSGIRKLTLDQVVKWKQSGPQDLDEPWHSLPDRQWWWPKPDEGVNPGGFLEHLFFISLLYLRNHAAEILGDPVIGWFEASVSVNDQLSPPRAHIAYRVNGSKQSALVKVEAHQEGRMWPISKIVLDTGVAEARVFSGESVRGCGRAGYTSLERTREG
jgi:hypothetical protein